MLERKILSSSFLANWLNFFIEPLLEKIENPTKYELFRPKPLTLTLFLMMLYKEINLNNATSFP